MAPVVSGNPSLEFWHEFAEIHSLNLRVCADKVATNAPSDAPIYLVFFVIALPTRAVEIAGIWSLESLA
jgi:hypothetical protein